MPGELDHRARSSRMDPVSCSFLIERTTREHDPIFALPLNPLFYYFGRRDNPTSQDWLLPGTWRDEVEMANDAKVKAGYPQMGGKAASDQVKMRGGQIKADPLTSKSKYRSMAAKLNRRG